MRPLQQETTTKTTLQRKRNDACARIKATGSAKNNEKTTLSVTTKSLTYSFVSSRAATSRFKLQVVIRRRAHLCDVTASVEVSRRAVGRCGQRFEDAVHFLCDAGERKLELLARAHHRHALIANVLQRRRYVDLLGA